jgi:hypothetical protein
MKDKFKKKIKKLLFGIIIISVFIISFIFVNNKVSLNSKGLGNTLGAQSILTDKTIVNPYYYGVGDKGLTPLQVSMLTKVLEGNTPSFTAEVSPVSQVWYFAYPDSYPALKSIKDQNGFELIDDFKVTTGNIINLSGEKTTYRIYEYNNVTTLVSYKVTYIQS